MICISRIGLCIADLAIEKQIFYIAKNVELSNQPKIIKSVTSGTVPQGFISKTISEFQSFQNGMFTSKGELSAQMVFNLKNLERRLDFTLVLYVNDHFCTVHSQVFTPPPSSTQSAPFFAFLPGGVVTFKSPDFTYCTRVPTLCNGAQFSTLCYERVSAKEKLNPRLLFCAKRPRKLIITW